MPAQPPVKAPVKPVDPPAVAPISLIQKLASRFHVEPVKLAATLKATAFRQRSSNTVVSDEQLMALLVVADQYGLNPFTKEIYAFPSDGGIVPIVSVDGWARIMNQHPEFVSVTFKYNEPDDEVWCECSIVRKDREEPITVREYLAECKRDTGPWNSHSRRMIRHKTLIQAVRIAFGFAGIYDEDEGERTLEATVVSVTKPLTKAPEALGAPETARTVVPHADIRKALDAAGVPERWLCDKMTLGVLEDLPLARVDEALELIRNVNAPPDA